MRRLAVAFVCFLAIRAVAQSATASDTTAIQLAQKAAKALSAAAVQDITITGNVIWVFGSDYQTGTGTFKANAVGQSRADLSLSAGTRSDIRDVSNGTPSGAWQQNGGSVGSYSRANCMADASWFFPGLSSLAQASNPSFVIKYIGLEQHGGSNTQHVQLFQFSQSSLYQHLTTIDYYLDPVSFLPLAISSPVHPDLDASTDIPSEVRFANYQLVNGVQVPFRIQRILNGGVVTDISVTSVAFNTGIPRTTFILQ